MIISFTWFYFSSKPLKWHVGFSSLSLRFYDSISKLIVISYPLSNEPKQDNNNNNNNWERAKKGNEKVFISIGQERKRDYAINLLTKELWFFLLWIYLSME